jgi:hypothetical protein
LVHSGVLAVAVIDFSDAAGDAGKKVTIGGVDYLEADTEDFPNGVWTNGASGAASATSLAAAINGDTRSSKPPIKAVASTDKVFVWNTRIGPAATANLVVTENATTAPDVSGMAGASNDGRPLVAVANLTMNAVYAAADEVRVFVPFNPTGVLVQIATSAGVIRAFDGKVTIHNATASVPAHVKVIDDGSVNIASGDFVNVFVWATPTA